MFTFTSKKGMEKEQGGYEQGPPNWARLFVVQFHLLGWDCIQLGFHVCFSLPNIEIHVPFGFVRIGWVWRYKWA